MYMQRETTTPSGEMMQHEATFKAPEEVEGGTEEAIASLAAANRISLDDAAVAVL